MSVDFSITAYRFIRSCRRVKARRDSVAAQVGKAINVTPAYAHTIIANLIRLGLVRGETIEGGAYAWVEATPKPLRKDNIERLNGGDRSRFVALVLLGMGAIKHGATPSELMRAVRRHVPKDQLKANPHEFAIAIRRQLDRL